jgi:hypothetical protein
MLHDTLYRRARRAATARLHGLDDLVARWRHPRRRVMFEAASPMSFAIFRPVYERLRRDPRLELWFTAYGRGWKPEDIYGRAGIVENVVATDVARWMKVDAYVNADFWDMTWLHRRTRRLHLFHGVAGKYALDAPLELAPLVASFDSLMFVNEDRRTRYIEAGLVADDPLRAALVGYPKADCLVDGSLKREAIGAGLGLDPRIPTVIYAPTWSPYSSLHAMGEEVIDRLAAEGLQVIAKLHDRSYDTRGRASGGVDWAARLARYDAHPRVRVVREGDASPLLVASDAMVSDHSSVAFEFAILDRPIVVIDCPELIYHARINTAKVSQLRSGSTVVADARACAAAVVEALRDPARLSPHRRQMASDLFYKPGTASSRAASIIYRMVELPDAIGAHSMVESDPARPLAAVG